jgi:Uma2 family endonuclease
MSHVAHGDPIVPSPRVPPLRAGEQLDQKTFHARYEAMPSEVRAELVGGIVSMQSPLGPRHGGLHSKVVTWLGTYEEATPGVEAFDNTTAILSDESEPQPDSYLIVLPEKGGQMAWSREFTDFLEGPPEFIAEVAFSSESFDLNDKRSDYERAGVREYLVVAIRQRRVYWFVNQNGAFVEVAPDADGVFRSQVFPGLWLDAAAVLRRDLTGMLAVLRQGLASPEHRAFADELQRR